ncbi:unnamed protein product, partial [marine sediment metagenome]
RYQKDNEIATSIPLSSGKRRRPLAAFLTESVMDEEI